MQSDSLSLLLGFLTQIYNSLSPFPPGPQKQQQYWEQLRSCHTAAPQPLLCPVLTGLTTQEGHFGPFIKKREAEAGDLLEIQVSEGHC